MKAAMSRNLHVSFELTMPNRSSWNGRWSGEDKRFIRILTVSNTEANRAKFKKLVGGHYYNFGDGWGANVEVKLLADGVEKRRLTKLSSGFCGYDWMIDSLRWYGKIMNDSQRKAHIEASRSTGASES